MSDVLKLIYQKLYTPLKFVEFETAAKENHQQLIERLEKPERKSVLRIIDAKDNICDLTSFDSFICGFKLAWDLATQLNMYKQEHSYAAEYPRR